MKTLESEVKVVRMEKALREAKFLDLSDYTVRLALYIRTLREIPTVHEDSEAVRRFELYKTLTTV